jgi:hypothetical protein
MVKTETPLVLIDELNGEVQPIEGEEPSGPLTITSMIDDLQAMISDGDGLENNTVIMGVQDRLNRMLRIVKNIQSLETVRNSIAQARIIPSGNLEGVRFIKDRELFTKITVNTITLIRELLSPVHPDKQATYDSNRLVMSEVPDNKVIFIMMRFISKEFFTKPAIRMGYAEMFYQALEMAYYCKYMPNEKIQDVYDDVLNLHNGLYDAYIKTQELLERDAKNRRINKNREKRKRKR